MYVKQVELRSEMMSNPIVCLYDEPAEDDKTCDIEECSGVDK